MRSTLRTAAACLLMLMLPLQGFAAAAGLRAMSPCPMMAMMHGDCQHAMRQAAPDPHAPHATHAAQHGDAAQHSQHVQDKGSCDMGMNCPAFGAPGLLSAGQPLSIDPGAASLHAATEPHFSSHIPEGLQRPPRHTA